MIWNKVFAFHHIPMYSSSFFPIYLQPGSASIVKKLWIKPVVLALNIIPWAILHSMKILPKDKMSTGFVDRIDLLCITTGSKPKRSPMLSLWRKLIWLPW